MSESMGCHLSLSLLFALYFFWFAQFFGSSCGKLKTVKKRVCFCHGAVLSAILFGYNREKVKKTLGERDHSSQP
jgi:hypothetical protein